MILLYLIYFLIFCTQSTTPLRYGYDSFEHDLQIYYSGNGTRYLLIISQFIFVDSIKLCFRQRPVVNNPATTSCRLENMFGGYDCLQIFLQQQTATYWATNSKLEVQTQSIPFILGSFTNQTYIICSLDGAINGSVEFNFIQKTNTVYEIAAIPYDITSPIITYAQTFSSKSSLKTDNILFPRQVLCYSYYNINHLIFLGGVLRDGSKFYLASFLSYHQLGSQYSFWGGLSFSQDKARRDMLGIFPQLDNYADLYSIYASAPFKDTSLNINGSQDWSLLSSNFRISQGQKSSYYFMSLSRPYVTDDGPGDEDIIPKINNRYCYVGWTSQQTSTPMSDEPYIDKSYMHKILQCFTPDLSLYLQFLFISCTSMILIMLI